MLEFDKLKLKECVYFRNAELSLNSGQILIVNGKNLKSREKNQSNGSGKSLFFSYIPNILFANHPLAIRANSKKEMFLSSDANATLSFKVNEIAYRVSQLGGSNISYKIYKDGKHINPKTTATKSEQYISEVLPISESEFYTLVYLNSQRDFVFQRGKFESRLKFFTEFFRLDYYDQMKEYFQEELRKVKKVEIEVSAYESQRLKFVEDLKELEGSQVDDIDELEERKAGLQTKKKKANAKLSKLSKQQGYLELHAQVKKSIGTSKRPSKERVAELQKLIANLEEQQELRASVKARKVKVKKLDASIAELQAELNSIYQGLFKKDFDKPFELDTAIESKYRKAKEQKENHETLVADLEDAEKRLAALKKTKASKEDLQSKLDECKQQIKTYNKLKEHIDDDKCPICGSTVDLATIKKKALDAKAKIAEIEAQLEYLEVKAEVAKLKKEVESSESADSFDKIQKEYKQFAVKKEKFSEVQRLYSKLQTQQADLKEEKAELKKELAKVDDSDLDDLDALRDESYNAKQTAKLYQQLDDVVAKAKKDEVSLDADLADIKGQIKELETLIHKMEVKIEELAAIINKNNVHLEKEKLIRTKLKEVNQKIEDLNVIIADKEILETLVKVYSNKGIKIQKINSICRLIEKNLNHFKSLLFGENFKFKINITDKAFDVIVDRGDGIVSDVRHLSGSEGRRFNLLLLISLLPLTPKSRRSNLVILDEMESNSDEVSLRLFCERFIPELHKFIPNVIVVSPLALQIPNAQRVTVVKDETGSRLEFNNRMTVEVNTGGVKRKKNG